MAVFYINGRETEVTKNQKLLRYLRDTLHLTSVKDGCSEGACGACTVLIDGEPIRACTPDTDSLEGRHILTVEGLSDWEKELYTFCYGEAGAVQCGFCIPGMVLCTKALLDKNPDPTQADIRSALRNNYCRCTGYVKIFEAVRLAAKYKKLGDQKNTANAWGDWDPEKYTVEDSCFGFVVMENGATVSVESSWALNIADPREASTLIAGVKGGADMLTDDLRINYVKNGRQVIETPNFNAGGVAFYDGASDKPEELECRAFYDAVLNGAELRTKPEQAMVVTQILEAIYKSAETGKPVYFD